MASSKPSLPDKPKKWAAVRMIAPARAMSTTICTNEMPPSLTTSPENETHSQCDDPDLQPEFVCLNASAEDAVQADGVGHDEADHNRPQHILDVGHCPMLMVRK